MASRVALLARKTGRPVRISNSREESLLESTKRHRFVARYKAGVKRDGRLTAMEIQVLADAGAYAVKTPLVTFRSCAEATGPYVVPNVRIDVYSVLTNNNDSGAFRGFGAPQIDFACESMMDELAEELNMDAYPFRRMNAFERGCQTATGQVLSGSVTVRRCMDEAISRVPGTPCGLPSPKARSNAESGWRQVGEGCPWGRRQWIRPAPSCPFRRMPGCS